MKKTADQLALEHSIRVREEELAIKEWADDIPKLSKTQDACSEYEFWKNHYETQDACSEYKFWKDHYETQDACSEYKFWKDHYESIRKEFKHANV